MAVGGSSKYIVFIKIWRSHCMFNIPLISDICKSTIKNEDGSFSQPCTFKKEEFYLWRLFKRILKLQAFKSQRYLHLFSLWSFSLKSKLYPVSVVSGLDACGAIRVQSYDDRRRLRCEQLYGATGTRTSIPRAGKVAIATDRLFARRG